jgi:hypothetical protein
MDNSLSLSKRMDNKEDIYNVDIDFNGASKAWRKNKTTNGKGSFEYCCGYIKDNGEKCRAPPKRWSQNKYSKDYIREWGPCRYHDMQFD